MFRWLKSLFFPGPDVPEDNTLTVLLGKEMLLVHAVATAGILLRVRTPNGERVIGEAMACDQAKYRRIWKRLYANQPPLVWEDGTPFNPWND